MMNLMCAYDYRFFFILVLNIPEIGHKIVPLRKMKLIGQ